MASFMAKFKDNAKIGLKLVSMACVDACACGCTAAVVPIAMMNPVVGGLIIVGGGIVADAVSKRIVNPHIDESVEELSDYLAYEKEKRKAIKEAFARSKEEDQELEKEQKEQKEKKEESAG